MRNTFALAFAVTLTTATLLIAGTDAVIPVRPPDPPAAPELSTDRPDFTESTDTVSRGALQLEGGFLTSHHSLASGPSYAVGAPFPLLRIGLASFLELRLSTDGLASQSEFAAGLSQHHAGGSDLELAVKARLWDERKYLPAFAIIAGVSVPTGSSYFSSGSRDPLLDFCWSKSLPRGFDVGGNVNFRRNTAALSTEDAESVTAGKALPKGFRIYGEIYRISPVEDDERIHWIANTGVTHLLGPNAQIDIEIGHTVNARTPYWFAGAGFAIRIPHLPAFLRRSTI